MGSGGRLLGKLQDRELGITRQKQQQLGDDVFCPGGLRRVQGLGSVPKAIASITLPLLPKCTEGTGQCLHPGHLLCTGRHSRGMRHSGTAQGAHTCFEKGQE